ncbi:MAG: S9 family peptidase, partial [Acidobacteria bacterium]|nr:S9 family peptidase [Acidobacteriota bacterium]
MLGVLLHLTFFCAPAVAAGPPAARRSDHVDVLHGVRVPDPYRWMEDVDSAETRAFVKAQSRYAREYLDKLDGRERLKKRLAEIQNFTRTGMFFQKRGGRYFFLRQDGLQNQPVMYVQRPGGAARVLLDPNTLSKDGTAALSAYAPSPDGKWLAYGIEKAGSDWQQWRIRNVETGRDLEDVLEWIKFSNPTWTAGGSGFYYARYPKPERDLLTASNEHNKLYYHKLGTRQAEDKLIYERPDQKNWYFDSWVSEDGRYLVVIVNDGTRVENLIYYQDLRAGGKMKPLITEFTGAFYPAGSKGSVAYFYTTDQASRGRLAAVDLEKPSREAWKNVIPESRDTLEQAVYTAGHLFCQYLKDVTSAVRIYSLDGKFVREVKLPGLGTVNWAWGEQEEPEQFFSYAGFSTPITLYRYDVKTGQSTAMFPGKPAWDPGAFETRQVFYPSRDGTEIPMFLVHRKGLKAAHGTPALLYGYGGFSSAVRPSFSVLYLAWMEMGGLVAVANLRGGNEYGEAWHQAGMKHHKQNVFDDFLAAADWLIAGQHTSASKLAILGASNGGLLVGACLNQRPDLFGAAIPQVGVMDMLRFHKFTIGQAWASDYGSP